MDELPKKVIPALLHYHNGESAEVCFRIRLREGNEKSSVSLEYG